MSETLQSAPCCIATGLPLSGENDSEAHIIPNAIGGRLKPLGVLSRRANSKIGDKVEGPFLKNYQQLIALIRGKRQRGEHPSYRVEGPDGKTYLIKPDGSLSPGKPEYTSEPQGEGEQVQIVARTMAEARTLLGQVAKKYPHFDVEHALKHAIPVAEPAPQINISFSVGPNVLFPMVYVAAATFNGSRGLPVHPDFMAYYSQIATGTPTIPSDTFYWEPEQIWEDLPNASTHLITTIASPRLAKAITIIRLIGLPGVAVVTDYADDHPRCATYAVDVIHGANVEVPVQAATITNMNWQPTHKLGDTSLYELQARRMNEVLSLAKDLGYIR